MPLADVDGVVLELGWGKSRVGEGGGEREGTEFEKSGMHFGVDVVREGRLGRRSRGGQEGGLLES